jgi:flavin reductase (DIM6/NTAB) family NADH-FMN oxidoreductase RutF
MSERKILQDQGTQAGVVLAEKLDAPAFLDPKAYRDAMSEIASAVHVIATAGAAGSAGMTVTAVASVSDQPPTLLVCVNRQLASAQRFIDNGVFSVNSLGVADQPLADVFAGRSGLHFEERFAHGQWKPGVTGAPLLDSALATFECRLIEVKDVATHHIFIGEVVSAERGPESPNLLYHRRAYVKSED